METRKYMEPSGAYLLIEKQNIHELAGDVTVLEHGKSGATVILIDTEEENKTFCIGFQTLPQNDTGVFHIIEHSIMNGSQKYKMQGLYSQLMSCSLSNYVNAMTFDDKTIYPFATTNEVDYLNMMDVYMDMAFHPIFLKDASVFLKEGWHFESGERDENNIGGVVYNEMCGAFSSLDTELEFYLKKQMFPDSPYGFFSGGHPDQIPKLTIEEYVNQYRKYYHPQNCVIVLTGKMDYEEKLLFLDEHYLSKMERQECFKVQVRLQDPVRKLFYKNRSDLVENGNRIAVALGYGIKELDLRQRVLGLYILEDVLMSRNDSPLKKLLLEDQVVQDVEWEIKQDMRQPYLLMRLYGLIENQANDVQARLEQCIQKTIENGIDKKALLAAIEKTEFMMRDSNDSVPAGIIDSVHVMDGWNYSKDLKLNIEYEKVFKELRRLVPTNFFEDLLVNTLCNNPHMAQVSLYPMGQEEQYLEEQHQLMLLNEITVNDLNAKRKSLKTIQQSNSNFLFWNKNVDYKNLAYVNFYFDISQYPKDDLGYVSLFCDLLGSFGTKLQTAEEINTEISSKIGKWDIYGDGFVHPDTPNKVKAKLVFRTSSLEHNLDSVLPLVEKLLFQSVFKEGEELFSEIEQLKNNMKRNMTSNGTYYAIIRVNAVNSLQGKLKERLSGLTYYYFLCNLLESYKENEKKIVHALHQVQKFMQNHAHLIVSYSGKPDYSELILDGIQKSGMNLCKREEESLYDDWNFLKEKEAFIISGSSCYLSSGCVRPYCGELIVGAKLLSLGYLWKEVRDKNGAYGVGVQENLSGVWNVNSYRDPEMRNTLNIFSQMNQYLGELKAEDELIIQSKLGVIENYCRSQSMTEQVSASERDLLGGISEAFYEKIIQQMKNVTLESLINILSASINRDVETFCCIGPEQRVVEMSDQFDQITILN